MSHYISTLIIWSDSGILLAGAIFFLLCEVCGLWLFDDIGLNGPFFSGLTSSSDDLDESGGLNKRDQITHCNMIPYLPGDILVSSEGPVSSVLSNESRLRFSGGSDSDISEISHESELNFELKALICI